ncbi:MAG TPA: hypothetical protein VH540_12520 [Ktedonobacterales bacterium]|jgi:hypothetical protein
MKTISALLVLFLAVGLFARKFNGGVRFLLLAGIVVVVIYSFFS